MARRVDDGVGGVKSTSEACGGFRTWGWQARAMRELIVVPSEGEDEVVVRL